MKFAIIDAANLFNRAHHVCSGDAFTKAGMALHIVFNSLRKVFRERQIDHIVIAGEGRSWRYDYYPQYKAKRILNRKLATSKEKEEQEVFREVLTDLMDFFAEKTRVTVLQAHGAEGDDFIARWVQLHPNDEHVIISADSDNVQLLADNVVIYDGITDRLITLGGIFDGKGDPMVFRVDPAAGKIKVSGTIKDAEKALKKEVTQALKDAKEAELMARAKFEKNNTEDNRRAMLSAQLEVTKASYRLNEKFIFKPEKDWHKLALFLKIIRGDIGDGIFSCNPGVRFKGSKNKVGIEDAWNDRFEKGYHWNNFMQNTWDKLVEGKEEPVEVKVIDEFAINEMLIDLTCQPEEIKNILDKTILEAVQKHPVGSVGINFARFCKKHELNRIGADATDHAAYLGAPYSKEI